MSQGEPAKPHQDTTSQLRRSLGLPTVIGQAVASIGLTATAVATVPAIYLTTGSATWTSFAIATVLVILVALTINLFARRVSGPGALADFVDSGLGKWAGIVAGWVLVLTYAGNVICLIGAFADNVLALFDGFGIQQFIWVVPAAFIFCALFCLLLSRREVHGSAIIMLVTEILSVTVIIILCGFILFRHDLAFDASQFTPHIGSMGEIQASLLLAVLSFAGFESATTLGGESNAPLRTIPRALIISVLIAGTFFIFAAYVITLGFRAAPAEVAQANNALEQLALHLGLPRASRFIALGGSVCFLGAALASLTALARVLFALANRGVLPSALAKVHPRYQTPSVALCVGAITGVVGAFIFLANGVTPRELFEYMGTFAVCGFLSIYFLVAISAPFYLKKTGALSWKSLFLCGVTAVAIAAFAVASVYPPQAGVYGIIPWVYLALLVLGIVVIAVKLRFARKAGNVFE